MVVIGVIATPIPVVPGFVFWIPGAYLLHKERKERLAKETKNTPSDS